MKKKDTIKIDGTEYEVLKLKFKGQRELAKILVGFLKSISAGTNEKGGTNYSFNFHDIMSAGPEVYTPVVAMGLGIEEEKVDNFEDGEAVLEAFEMILDKNKVSTLLGKSQTLLKHIGMN